MAFFTPVFIPGLLEIMLLLLRFECQEKDFLLWTLNLNDILSVLFIWDQNNKYVHTLT